MVGLLCTSNQPIAKPSTCTQYRKMRTNIHALNGVQSHDHSVQEAYATDRSDTGPEYLFTKYQKYPLIIRLILNVYGFLLNYVSLFHPFHSVVHVVIVTDLEMTTFRYTAVCSFPDDPNLIQFGAIQSGNL
jgi:hypothetical protein